MTTLKEKLLKEGRPAVIFGHIHRRQVELSGKLLLDRSQRDYDAVTTEDLLDYMYILFFKRRLTHADVLATTSEECSYAHDYWAMRNALTDKGVDEVTFCLNGVEAQAAASRIIFGLNFDGDAYKFDGDAYAAYHAINPDIPLAA